MRCLRAPMTVIALSLSSRVSEIRQFCFAVETTLAGSAQTQLPVTSKNETKTLTKV